MSYSPASFNNNCIHLPFWDHFAPTLSQMKVFEHVVVVMVVVVVVVEEEEEEEVMVVVVVMTC